MNLLVLNPRRVVYEGEAGSVVLPGDRGEFEIMDYHVPLVGLLRQGYVTVDWQTRLPIKNGIVKFDRNECVVVIEE